MRFIKGRWVKYSNRIFPRYVRKHYEVRVSRIRVVAFNSFEYAMIFQELINIKRKRKRR